MIDVYDSGIFKIAVPAAKSRMEATILEAVALPSRAQWQRNSAPADVTAAAREDTRGWLEQLIHADFRGEPALRGAWSIVNGQDALIGSWAVGERVIQVIVTRDRIHVSTRLPSVKAQATEAEMMAAAVALGRELFGLGEETAVLANAARRLGDFAFATPDSERQLGFRTTYLVVTDGVSAKYSFVKLNGDPREIKGVRPFAPPAPWFGARPRAMS